ncbi:Mid-cell-anchored protein Z [Lactococcus hodotermopsidis]|uniref:Mid-cell-anchored protein Z n=1 Tax=Pseudolactococcus hodotermopsidis TaxID=2709157 RepID=A0A6A0BC88_9LACT|nr:cell division site-positioning protein MapZ family protein [Lactococcus hodotermopsidis]GFH42285.1 Mid-cell-anchored protein Z [Lactococcus hodotermopsidis]
MDNKNEKITDNEKVDYDSKVPYKEKTLDLKDVEKMTVAEISTKSNHISEENLVMESSLDKYIRQHRSDIESAKKARELKAAVTNKELDKLVRTARDEVVSPSEEVSESEDKIKDDANSESQSELNNELISETVVADKEETSEVELESDFPELQGAFDKVVVVPDDVSLDTTEETLTSEEVSVASDTKSEPESTWQILTEDDGLTRSEKVSDVVNKYKKPVVITICGLLLLVVGGLVWHNDNQTNQKQTVQTSKSQAKQSEEAEKTAAFNKVYASFFIDDKETKLKNSEFSDYKTKLTAALAKVNGQSNEKTLEAKVEELKAQIVAVQKMNADFDKAVIVDGALDKTAKVKEGVTLSFTATENTALNNLLKEAVALGKTQQNTVKSSAELAKEAEQVAVVEPSVAASTTAQNSEQTSSQSAPQNSGPVNASNSRVPVDANANLSDPAYTWAPGIMELVLNKCRERGYITGDNYILQPASIQNGNGYYNLYRPDGTYLVSINCKTGYFVGNGAGHADALDY